MAIDFKEIPEAHKASGRQDTFEQFARDWLELSNFKIVEAPGRGADGGKDLIVSEERHGLLGKNTVVRWLVSCKHYAHSGSSVGVSDEDSIGDRVRSKSCDGFLGFYSTIPSSALLERVKNLRDIETIILDGRNIEGTLIAHPNGAKIFKRYFPDSFARWEAKGGRPANIFSDQENPQCKFCDRDLLEAPYIGNIIQWEDDQDVIVEVYCTCKRAACSKNEEWKRHKKGWSDVWEDVSDMTIPSIYIARLMGFLNSLKGGQKYTDDAFQETKEIYLRLFPHVSRSLSAEEQIRVSSLLAIPSWLGGIGKDE